MATLLLDRLTIAFSAAISIYESIRNNIGNRFENLLKKRKKKKIGGIGFPLSSPTATCRTVCLCHLISLRFSEEKLSLFLFPGFPVKAANHLANL